MFSPDGTLISASEAPHCGGCSQYVIKATTASAPLSHDCKTRQCILSSCCMLTRCTQRRQISRFYPFHAFRGKMTFYDTTTTNNNYHHHHPDFFFMNIFLSCSAGRRSFCTFWSLKPVTSSQLHQNLAELCEREKRFSCRGFHVEFSGYVNDVWVWSGSKRIVNFPW